MVVQAEQLCKDWRHQTVSKDDKITQDTAAGMEASNKSRPNWGCAEGRDEAKKG